MLLLTNVIINHVQGLRCHPLVDHPFIRHWVVSSSAWGWWGAVTVFPLAEDSPPPAKSTAGIMARVPEQGNEGWAQAAGRDSIAHPVSREGRGVRSFAGSIYFKHKHWEMSLHFRKWSRDGMHWKCPKKLFSDFLKVFLPCHVIYNLISGRLSCSNYKL